MQRPSVVSKNDVYGPKENTDQVAPDQSARNVAPTGDWLRLYAFSLIPDSIDHSLCASSSILVGGVVSGIYDHG